MLKYDFYRVWYLPSNGPSRLVYSVTLTFIFKVKLLLLLCIIIKNAHAADVPGRFTSTRTAPAMELLLLSQDWWLYCRLDVCIAGLKFVLHSWSLYCRRMSQIQAWCLFCTLMFVLHSSCLYYRLDVCIEGLIFVLRTWCLHWMLNLNVGSNLTLKLINFIFTNIDQWKWQYNYYPFSRKEMHEMTKTYFMFKNWKQQFWI